MSGGEMAPGEFTARFRLVAWLCAIGVAVLTVGGCGGGRANNHDVARCQEMCEQLPPECHSSFAEVGIPPATCDCHCVFKAPLRRIEPPCNPPRGDGGAAR